MITRPDADRRPAVPGRESQGGDLAALQEDATGESGAPGVGAGGTDGSRIDVEAEDGRKTFEASLTPLSASCEQRVQGAGSNPIQPKKP